jgi:hypothetical protein
LAWRFRLTVPRAPNASALHRTRGDAQDVPESTRTSPGIWGCPDHQALILEFNLLLPMASRPPELLQKLVA